MKRRILIAALLLTLLTTISSQIIINFSKFNLEEINIENNTLVEESDLKSLLNPFYNKNLILINNNEIGKVLLKNSFIESFKIKKKYPNTLNVVIFEKKPIAILLNKKKKFFISEKIELIEYRKISKFENLPYVLGNKDDFKNFYYDLKKIKFPLDKIKKYTFYESKRWDLETKNNVIVKLPSKNYLKSLKNYLESSDKNNFQKYKIFDYRIDNQLILK